MENYPETCQFQILVNYKNVNEGVFKVDYLKKRVFFNH